jgi:hypothetical protein
MVTGEVGYAQRVGASASRFALEINQRRMPPRGNGCQAAIASIKAHTGGNGLFVLAVLSVSRNPVTLEILDCWRNCLVAGGWCLEQRPRAFAP